MLYLWKKQGLSNKDCARRLDRHSATIGRELTRNRYVGEHDTFYEPLSAQGKFEKRQRLAWAAKHPLKNPQLFNYVTERLRWGWSPESISGRLKYIEHPGQLKWQISPETIYQFVYHPWRKKEGWWEYLRRKQKRRRHKQGRKSQRVRIPDRVSIHARPQEISNRSQFGHWEGDTVVGLGRKSGLHTAYERVTSLIRIERMLDLTARSSLTAQRKIYSPLPPEARRSTTLDNGLEHVLHTKLKRSLSIPTYFADPYSAWQRGGNENANLWVRYYFPKRTDFATIPEEDLRAVEWELNHRPRKRLGFKTPTEVFSENLARGCVS